MVFSDAPECSRKGQLIYYAGIGERLKLVCHINAYPKNNLFYEWNFKKSMDKQSLAKSEKTLRYVY